MLFRHNMALILPLEQRSYLLSPLQPNEPQLSNSPIIPLLRLTSCLLRPFHFRQARAPSRMTSVRDDTLLAIMSIGHSTIQS